MHVTGHRVKTHTVSNTAFRGFGGPQGMLAIEDIIDAIARASGIDPLDVRKRNLYRRRADATSRTTGRPWSRRSCRSSSSASSAPPTIAPGARRSDASTRTARCCAAAGPDPGEVRHLLHGQTPQPGRRPAARLHDGSIQLNHGGTEMGQGLYTKVAQVVASELAVDIGRIRCTATRTDKVPNTSPTAASSGSDINGMAALARRARSASASRFRRRALRRARGQRAFSRQRVSVGEGIPLRRVRVNWPITSACPVGHRFLPHARRSTTTATRHGRPFSTTPTARRYPR
jgi:xanthine dehydrogenase large subunit